MPFSDTYRDYLLGVLQGDISHVALVSSDDVLTDTTDISTLPEKGRVVPSINQTGNKLVVQSTFPAGTGNCSKTTISGGIGSNYFDVTSITGFAIGNRILVNGVRYKISNISGSTITTSVNLNPVPIVGNEVKQVFTQFHMVDGGTGIANTGSTTFSNEYEDYKESPQVKKHVSYITVNGSARIEDFTVTPRTIDGYIIYASDKDTRLYLYKTDFAKSYDDKLTNNTTYIEGEFVSGQIRSDGAYIIYDA